MSLLEVTDLRVEFKGRSADPVHAVNGIDLIVERAETIGVVGESGCGKSTLARALIGLVKPSDGSIKYDGIELTGASSAARWAMRRRMQMVFQDPFASLDPRMRIGQIISEPLRIHKLGGRTDRQRRIEDLLDLVELPSNAASSFPHEVSGGQRQRVGIARALAAGPELLILDEPVSALDVSIQAQILNLLIDLRERLQIAFIFISHDLSVVRHVSNKVVVMYLGKIVESGPASELFSRPAHPYTQALLAAAPLPDPRAERQRERIVLSGELPSPMNLPTGCPFHTRCPIAIDVCRHVAPVLEIIPAVDGRSAPPHIAACHRTQTPISRSR